MSSRLVRGDIEAIIAPLVWSISGRDHVAGEAATKELPNPQMEQALEREVDNARQRGFREGRAEAGREYEMQIEPLAARLEEIVAAFAGPREGERRDREEQLVELSIAVSRRILHRELTVDPDAVRALVKAALDRIESRELRRVRTHPAHRDFVQSVLDRARPDRNIELVADETLGQGSLLFETEHGDLDASVDSQLEEIRRGLVDRL
jgi:flagellar assembly protein FliH